MGVSDDLHDHVDSFLVVFRDQYCDVQLVTRTSKSGRNLGTFHISAEFLLPSKKVFEISFQGCCMAFAESGYFVVITQLASGFCEIDL
jgi:hypothetical protein